MQFPSFPCEVPPASERVGRHPAWIYGLSGLLEPWKRLLQRYAIPRQLSGPVSGHVGPESEPSLLGQEGPVWCPGLMTVERPTGLEMSH